MEIDIELISVDGGVKHLHYGGSFILSAGSLIHLSRRRLRVFEAEQVGFRS